MKTIISLSAGLVATTLASGSDNLGPNINKVATEVAKKLKRNIKLPPGPRAITELTSAGYPYEYIKNYGCWCSFDNYRAGKKDPVNFIDTQCKLLHDNYECINRANPGCQSELDTYKDTLIRSFVIQAAFLERIGDDVQVAVKVDQFITRCGELNAGNDCLADACKAESFFIYKVVLDLLDVDHDDPNRHENGFKKETECATAPGNPDRLMVCCGDAPYARIFNENGPSHMLSPDTCTDAKGDTLSYP